MHQGIKMSRREKVLVLVSGLLVIILVIVAISHVKLRIHVVLAREQVEVFETLRRRADASDSRDTLDLQRAIREYYPSGTKQVTGSDLDSIVERFRALAIEALECVSDSGHEPPNGNQP